MMDYRRFILPVAILAALGCVVLCASGAGSDEDAADAARGDLHSVAYVAIIKAEQARDNDQPARATKLFQEALNAYRQLQLQFPDWHTRIVEARIP